MKRRIVCCVLICMMLFAGCSSADKGESSAPADNQETTLEQADQDETAEQAKKDDTEKSDEADTKEEADTKAEAETKTEDDTEEETKQVSLNVEKDTFTFDDLARQIGADEKSAITVLGAEEKSDSYTTELFGEAVVITLNVKEEKVDGIQMEFQDTDAELLTNAIAEQLGSDGEAGEKTVIWKQENCTVELQKTKQGCSVEISGQE